MNVLTTIKELKGNRTIFNIYVDGKPLSHHFSGRLGFHPSEISPLGWSTASKKHRTEIVAQFLGEKPSELDSKRVPVLVCEECGDLGCGAIAVRIILEGEHVKWTDWYYENGYEPGHKITWRTWPSDFEFEFSLYKSEIHKTLEK
ncbi:MAG: hypothetical protein JSW33_02145 [bacterium]|nr:MAG: hypothetical protein JSW33_02145 [bacterium]